MGILDEGIALAKEYWWIGAGLVIVALIFIILKKDKKPIFFDQVTENKERSEQELMWNPTPLRFIKHLNKSYRVYGEIFCVFKKQLDSEVKQQTWKEFDMLELRKKKLEDIKRTIKKEEVPKIEAYRFLVRRKYLELYLTKIFYGKKETLFIEAGDFRYIKKDTIKLDDNLRVVWRQGFYTKMKPEFIEIVTDMTERFMKDHTINAVGQQQKDFSRVKTDYAHSMDMKETDIKAEEKKDKAKRHG